MIIPHNKYYCLISLLQYPSILLIHTCCRNNQAVKNNMCHITGVIVDCYQNITIMPRGNTGLGNDVTFSLEPTS